MALILKDRVKETTAVTSTGTATLLGAVTGYQSFSVIGNGNTCYYTIATQAGSEWEVGVGTYTSPNQLARTTVLSSSNSGSLVNFSAGTKDVFVTQPAGEAVYINDATGRVEAFGNGANTISFTNITANLFTGNASAISAINASNISSGTVANARTTAASANGASTIVLRDSSGSFSAGDITANSISGNGVALTAINASNVSSGTLSATRGGTGSANLTAENVILGNGANAVKVVAPGTANNVLTSNGTTWISQAAGGGFAAGTVMLFAQTSAPTGWTKNVLTGDNSALRVVTGTASTGGSVGFTTAFASQTPTGSVSITSVAGSAGATTLTTPQIPSHSHTVSQFDGSGSPGTRISKSSSAQNQANTPTSSTGGGDSHTHPFSFSSGSGTFSGNAINLAVQYIDVIRATKD